MNALSQAIFQALSQLNQIKQSLKLSFKLVLKLSPSSTAFSFFCFWAERIDPKNTQWTMYTFSKNGGGVQDFLLNTSDFV